MGLVDVLVVGGCRQHYENLPAGEAFFEDFNSENDCLPQQVIISQKCYLLCKQMKVDMTVQPVGSVGNFWVKEIKTKLRKRKMEQKQEDMNWKDNPELFQKFSRYIPSAVVPHLRMPEQAWVGELRQVTIMFLSLPFNAEDIRNIRQDESVLDEIHQSIWNLQEIIYNYQDSLNKFLVDYSLTRWRRARCWTSRWAWPSRASRRASSKKSTDSSTSATSCRTGRARRPRSASWCSATSAPGSSPSRSLDHQRRVAQGALATEHHAPVAPRTHLQPGGGDHRRVVW